MMGVEDKIAQLQTRYRELIAKDARAQAAYERAEEDLAEAKKALAAAGFDSVEAAQEWLRVAQDELTKRTEALDALLTQHGV